MGPLYLGVFVLSFYFTELVLFEGGGETEGDAGGGVDFIGSS